MSRYLKNEHQFTKEISDDVSRVEKQLEKIRKEFMTHIFLYGKGKVALKNVRRETWE